MANQVIVTNTGNVQVALTPPPNVQVQISRAAIGTVSNVPTANFANYAANVTSSNQPNITSVGTLGTLSVSGNSTIGNLVVTGNLSVGNLIANSANYANFAGVAFSVAGANVTGEVGFAAVANSVAVGNVSGIGNIATVNLDGNASNILFGNGTFSAIPVVSNVANANYANFAGTAFSVSGSNVSGEVANANYASFANIASTANSVAGANVSGEVANANYSSYSNIASTANSVAVGNVSGIGNIATTNYDGNASNILYGNGGFFALPIISNVGNANYANFAGEAFNVNASNITGTVANANYSAYAGEANTANLATFATTANAVAGANVSGEVANANYASFANIASTANLATFATTANAVAGANVSGEVANANYASFANVASIANSVTGANVSGEVANANYASFANVAASANSVAVGNVSGIGNIATINLDGSSSNVLFGNGVFAPESTSVANANYANFAGQVVDATQSNITSLGTLTSLSVTGNTTIADTLILSSNVLAAKIAGLDNGAFVNQRTLFVIAGNINSSNIANGNTAGSLQLFGGEAAASTDPGSRWNAVAGSASVNPGSAISGNGNATGGTGSFNGGAAFSNLYAAVGGVSQMTGGRAVAANGNSTGGNVTLLSGRANSTTTGTATSGNINLVIGNVVGASGNVRGNINIGSITPISTTTWPGAINIGQANTPININGNANVTGNLVVSGVISGNGSGITNISANFANFAGNVTVSSQPNITSVGTLTSVSVSGNANVTGNLNVTGNVSAQGSGFFNSPANNTDTLKLVTDNKTNMNMIRMERYGDTANLGGIGAFNMYRTGGTQAAPTAVANNDVVYNLTTSVYGDSGNIFVDTGGFVVRVGTNYGNGTVTSIAEYNQGSGGTGSVSFNYDTINFNGNINYTRTFGSFTSNATQTNSNVGNAVYMTLNNDEGSNGVSIVSSSQITVARPGRYNIQFSAQLEKTDAGTDTVEVWLTKNGSAVANSATRLALQGNNEKSVAAWNWVDQVTSANTYYQIAWGSTDANMQLVAIASANTLSGVAVPSLIVTVVPVGA